MLLALVAAAIGWGFGFCIRDVPSAWRWAGVALAFLAALWFASETESVGSPLVGLLPVMVWLGSRNSERGRGDSEADQDEDWSAEDYAANDAAPTDEGGATRLG